MSGSGSATAAAVRLRGLLRGRRERYAFCPGDRFWFRPLYTEGRCPLCGEEAAGDAAGLPLLVRIDRFWLGMGALGLASLGMCALVLLMYFRG